MAAVRLSKAAPVRMPRMEKIIAMMLMGFNGALLPDLPRCKAMIANTKVVMQMARMQMRSTWNVKIWAGAIWMSPRASRKTVKAVLNGQKPCSSSRKIPNISMMLKTMRMNMKTKVATPTRMAARKPKMASAKMTASEMTAKRRVSKTRTNETMLNTLR